MSLRSADSYHASQMKGMCYGPLIREVVPGVVEGNADECSTDAKAVPLGVSTGKRT